MKANSSPSAKTLFVIPLSCPVEDTLNISPAWGDGVITQRLLEFLFPPEEIRMESRNKQGLWLSWTCGGCTVGLGSKQIPCPQRKCGLGGKELI